MSDRASLLDAFAPDSALFTARTPLPAPLPAPTPTPRKRHENLYPLYLAFLDWLAFADLDARIRALEEGS